MSTEHLVLGYSWNDGAPTLRTRAGRATSTTTRKLQGRLHFKLLPTPQCIGFFEGGGLQPCPNSATVKRHQCDDCIARDRFRPCMTCDGFRCPRLTASMKRHCQATHSLYLACFGQDTLKVGTTSAKRGEQRIIEQGPLGAARIASGPGPRIKQMEHLLVSGPGNFVEIMRRAKKMALLASPMTAATARGLIADAFQGLPRLLPAEYHPLLHEPKWVWAPDIALESRGLPVTPLPLQDDAHIRGEVVGAVGHVVFLKDEDATFALDLGALKARRLLFDPPGAGRKPVVQLGMF